ncbi:MAG: alpha/beta hydrolase family protein [Henriciella sp.]
MRALGALLFGVLFSAFAHAEYPQPPLEAYGALPQISDAEISPDGTKIAAIVNTEAGTRMAVFNIGGGVETIIGIDSIKARGVNFYDNDHVILRVSETTATFGFRGDYEYSGAFAVSLEDNSLTQLLHRTRGIFPAQSGLGRIIGRGEKPGEVLMPAFMGEARTDPSFDLLRATLGTPRAFNHAKGTGDTIDWFVGEGGKLLARERYSNRRDLYRVQWREGSGWKTILETENEIIPMSILGTTQDETGLVFIASTASDEGYDALMKLGMDGEITGPILPTRDREIERIYADDNRKILGVRYAGVETDYAFLDETLQDSYEKMQAQLPDATIYLNSWSDDRETILYRVFSPSYGDSWLIHKRSEDTLGMVGSARPDIPYDALGIMMSIEYPARDGLTIQAILTMPPNYQHGNTGPLPTLVIPHGGPASYDRFDFDWMAQYFANRGYAVVQPNFRGSDGFGQAFEDAGRGEWGGAMQDDITDGIKALAAAKIIDPERVCIAGASYGGYAALAGATFTPELYKCVVAIAPVSDLNQMLRSERRDHGSDHWVISYWEDVMAEGDARRAKLESISPANFADNVTAPILLMHGDDDLVVPYNQSTRMKRALERADKSVELIKLKGEDHWLSVAETRLQTLKEMDAFISTHLPLEE